MRREDIYDHTPQNSLTKQDNKTTRQQDNNKDRAKIEKPRQEQETGQEQETKTTRQQQGQKKKRIDEIDRSKLFGEKMTE